MSFCRLVGCNHETAPLSVREHVAFHKDNLVAGLDSLMSLNGVNEAMIFSTCNRTEIYYCGGVAEEQVIGWLGSFHHIDVEWLKACLYKYEGPDALAHLARVAGGLDSISFGEAQVLGQLKEAYRVAKEHKTLPDELDKSMQFTFNLAKKLRSLTLPGKKPVSLAAAAVNLAQDKFSDFSRHTALVVGAGQNARLLTNHLVKKGIKKLYFANRTYYKAEELARQAGTDAQVVSLMDLEEILPDADMIFTSTASPTILIGKGMVEKALRIRNNKEIFIVDISVPRDMESSVAELPEVHLHTLDDLQRILAGNLTERKQATAQMQKVIDKAIDDHLKTRRSQEHILENYRRQVNFFKEDELHRALRDVTDPAIRQALTLLADRLAAKLSHEPSKMLRAARRKKDYRQLDYLAQGLLSDKITAKQRDDSEENA